MAVVQKTGYPLAVARKKKFPVRVVATLREGMVERIDALLEDTEDRTEFFRTALDREIQRREAAHATERSKRGRADR